MFVRRRPLLRAGMLAGTAYVAHQAGQNAARRRYAEGEQDERLENLESPPQGSAQPAASSADSPLVAQLSKLEGMLDAGTLSQDEFATAKQKLLAS